MKRQWLYPLLCVVGGVLVGFFAGHLDHIYGAVMFVFGVTLMVFASTKLKKK